MPFQIPRDIDNLGLREFEYGVVSQVYLCLQPYIVGDFPPVSPWNILANFPPKHIAKGKMSRFEIKGDLRLPFFEFLKPQFVILYMSAELKIRAVNNAVEVAQYHRRIVNHQRSAKVFE